MYTHFSLSNPHLSLPSFPLLPFHPFLPSFLAFHLFSSFLFSFLLFFLPFSFFLIKKSIIRTWDCAEPRSCRSGRRPCCRRRPCRPLPPAQHRPKRSRKRDINTATRGGNASGSLQRRVKRGKHGFHDLRDAGAADGVKLLQNHRQMLRGIELEPVL